MTKSATEVVVGVHEAKTHLSKLLERVARGDDIVITNRGHVVARIVADGESRRKPILGSAEGTFEIPPEFYEPWDEEFLAYFE